MTIKHLKSLGLFGGASLNYVETAVADTDGLDIREVKRTRQFVYPEKLCLDIRKIIAKRGLTLSEMEQNPQIAELEAEITDFYARIIQNELEKENIDIIGVDGLTILNNPAEKCSYQLEKGHELSRLLQRKIITHFHKADLLSGGQASPLSPAFFGAIGQNLPKPTLFINLDAVCSLIFLHETGEIIAFDCAPCMAMIEDWTFRHANMLTDYNGKLAATGKNHQQITESLLHHKILQKQPPKSLDIMCFADKKEHLEGLSLEDGAATATSFIAQAIKKAADTFLTEKPEYIYLSGAGTKNPSLVRQIKHFFAPFTVCKLSDFYAFDESVGAQITAFNAVRRLNGLPITYPTTTGAYEPMSGGEIFDEK